MNLVGYSDSESDGEAAPAPVPQPSLKQAPKPSFAKVVDRSNPGKIRVNLPGASLSQTHKDDIESEAPPAKKPRLGGASAFGGFNAMLPAPKKAAATATPAAATSGKRGLGKGLAAGVSLKTGAEPAFQRVSRAETEEYDENGDPIKKEPMNKDDFRAMLNLPPPKSDKKDPPKPELPAPSPQPELDTQAKPAAPRFVPMSVGKGKKKKPIVARLSAATTENTKPAAAVVPEPQVATAPAPPRKPKVSLFGAPSAESAPVHSTSTAEYQPLLYGTEENDAPSAPGNTFAAPASHYSQSPAIPNTAAPNELTNIASELNLSEAEKRQLFGKKGRGADFASARIVEFNTDTEYAHNEKLRQQGEQVQHNPLKSISGTGKNSLRSLVNVASTQKEALEDHFAAGYRNKKEAGNRYGW